MKQLYSIIISLLFAIPYLVHDYLDKNISKSCICVIFFLPLQAFLEL